MLLEPLAHRCAACRFRRVLETSERPAAVAGAACRGYCRAPICRAAPARCGWGRTSRSADCPARAGRRGASVAAERHSSEVTAVDVGNPVVPRQPLVEERVVRLSADRATLRSSRSWLSKNSSVSRWNASRRFSSKSGTCRRRVRVPQIAQQQPLAGEVVDERLARDRRACAAPAAPAPPGPSACPRRPVRAAHRRGCCSTGRTTDAKPARDR